MGQCLIEGGIDGQFVTEDDEMPVGLAAAEKIHKPLDSMDLALRNALCHDRKQICPIGCEPINARYRRPTLY